MTGRVLAGVGVAWAGRGEQPHLLTAAAVGVGRGPGLLAQVERLHPVAALQQSAQHRAPGEARRAAQRHRRLLGHGLRRQEGCEHALDGARMRQ